MEVSAARDAAARERTKAFAAENRALAAQARELREQERRREAADAAGAFAPTGVLDERKDDARFSNAPHRIRPDHYRGMDAAATEEFRAAQAAQIAEKQRAEEEAREAEWAAAALTTQHLRQMAQHENAISRAAAARKAEYIATLERQRAEQKAQRAAEREQGTQGGFGDGFFAGFGRSDR